MDWVFSGLGLVILLLAGDALVRGAVNLSLRIGIPALIVSLTIVAFGTSAPELLISITAALEGVPGIALGNVVGSNTANILLVLGIPALLATMHTDECETRKSYVLMIAGSVLFIALAFVGVFTWISGVVLLLALDNLGVDITALVAGLGVGGIAVALAVQNILGDLFASLSIVLDKPFEVGDFIVVGEFLGTVENVGLKTTRVRSLGGEQLVFANSDLLGARVRNYKRMQERRILFRFGVLYQTPPDQLEQIPVMVREIIEALPEVRFDRAHFFTFGDSSYDFEVVYWMQTPEYNRYMDTQQAINLALVRRFAEADIDFAYPTRTLFVEKMPGSDTH